MHQFRRRSFLRHSAAAVVTLLVLPGANAARSRAFFVRTLDGPADGVAPASTATSCDTIDPILEQAAAWIDQLRQRGETHLFYPVSRLQREFRTGYQRTCALADSLAQRGEWTIGLSGDGTRYARILAKKRA